MSGLQLIASDRLGDLMIKSDPKRMLKSVEEILDAMEAIAIIKVAVFVVKADVTISSARPR